MWFIDYNASEITSQSILQRKFFRIIKLLKDNDEEFEDFYNNLIRPQETLLRKYNILIQGLLNAGFGSFGEYYFESIQPALTMQIKLELLYNWLSDYITEE